MVSVTSEVLANASFQGAQARSARADSDQSAGNDSFATLVDSNAAASNNDNRAQDRAQDSAPAPRRSDDSQAASDNRARDNTPRRTRLHLIKPRATIPTTAMPRPRRATTPKQIRKGRNDPRRPNRSPMRRSPASPMKPSRHPPATTLRQRIRPGRRRMERPW